MKLVKKSEWFEFDSPIGEPDYDWKKYHGDEKYHIERYVKEDGDVIWFGINTNWVKKIDIGWTVLTTNEDAQPLKEYLPEIVYGSDRQYFKPCEEPIYEKLYNEKYGYI